MTRAAIGRATLSKSPAKTSVVKSAPRVKASEALAKESYFHRSERPLTNLAFLLPLLIIYEIGNRHFVLNPIVAVIKFQQFLSLFGATAQYLPSLGVVVILLTLHIVRGDPWRLKATDVPLMAIESALLALPLLGLWYTVAPYLAHLPLYAGSSIHSTVNVAGRVIPCIGAGIYEELIFRLISFNLFSFLLVDLLRVKPSWGQAATVLLSAVLFSAYHYLGSEHFSPETFVFRTIAGLYFAAIYLCRGFGVTCGTHASYDVIVVCLQVLR